MATPFSLRMRSFAFSMTLRPAASPIRTASQRYRAGARSMTRKWRDAFASDRSREAREVSGLAVLHVDPKTYKMGAIYQVDVGAKKLVEAPSSPGARTHTIR